MFANRGFTVYAGFLAVSLLSTLARAEPVAADVYQVQPGDVLQISVWREEGLEKEVLIRPDGGLSFPLVGNVQARGKSIEELQTEISEKLKRFIPDPAVTVAVQKLDGNNVYVIGKVARPGIFPMVSRMDVVQALSMAGGMTPYAAANKVKILRREGSNQTAIEFAYGDIEKGANLEQNIVLQAGDVVLVP